MTSRGDEVPLLNQEGEAHEEQLDTRFAIDEETAETQGHSDRLQDSPGSPKYPPSAPPPTYREATGTSLFSLIFSRIFSSVSVPDFSFIRRGGSSIWSFVCRFWPTSRFAQLGFFMMGLWVLVIVSGPAFEDAGPRAGAGYGWGQFEELANNGPGPISGDGHIVAPTNWTLRSCHNSHAHHGQIVCTSTTRVELDVPTVFNSTEGLFIYADPPRPDHMGDSRGRVPGTIEFKMVEEGSGNPDQSPKGKVQVIIDAQYEQNKIEVFERTTIVKMASRLYTQGVGIYTHPLPARYEHLDTAPLMLFITVLIPSGAAIPEFRTQASAMNIGVFTAPEQNKVTKGKHTRAPVPLTPPTFGRFSAITAIGSIRTGTDYQLDANGLVQFTTSNGNIVVAGKLHSPSVRLETLTGDIRLEEGCQVTASREAHLTTNTGSIELKKNSWILSGELEGKALTGSILGGVEGGTWKTNKSIELHTSNGALRASIDILKTTDRFYNPTEVVSVAATSKNGPVDLHYVGQEKGVVLRSRVETSIGTATAEMNRNFEGTWNLEGSKGSVVVPTGADDSRVFSSLGRKEGVVNVKEQGSLWFDVKAKHGESQSIVSSSIGIAQLRFA